MGYVFEAPSSYGFTPIQPGLLYLAPLVGSILGSTAGGKVSDLVACLLARNNHGKYEPEFRLFMVIPAAIIMTVALVGFGWGAQVETCWMIVAVFFGLIFFGGTLGATTAITYAIDCQRTATNHMLVVLSAAKSEFSLMG